MSKVSIVKCADYDRDKVEEALFRSVDLLGGVENFIKSGDTVLIKPNLLSARLPAEAVCTHPEVVRAAIRLVKRSGAKPLVGDSPGTFFGPKEINGVYEKTGIKSVADEEGAELVKFDKSRRINGYPVAECALNASLILSLPKLKTHALTVMTGAIKNTFGLIPGLFKVQCHKNKPKPKHFVKIIVDVYEITKPGLSIMDGIVAMEGEGPAAGDPVNLGLLLAGADGVSIDAVASRIVGVPPYKDIIVNEARRRDIGEADIGKIEVLGEQVDAVKIKNFRLPRTTNAISVLPDFLMDMARSVLDFRPFIDEALCKKCGICKASCPVEAITINESDSKIDNRICIRCFCCYEVCPYKAIYIKKNFITNLLWRD
ncbi:MAG: DUF362 domain-containing protein [Candidatus Omnitrophica bacterium]|nr:DUF362 domain-containing protein [Candidatus Omnitrophota bacterium]